MPVTAPDRVQRLRRVERSPEVYGQAWLEVDSRVALKTEHKTPTGSGSGSGPAWRRCDKSGCLGDAGNSPTCFVHSTAEVRSQLLCAPTRRLSVNGCRIDDSHWEVIAEALADGRVQHLTALGALFESGIVLKGVHSSPSLSLACATLGGAVDIAECTLGTLSLTYTELSANHAHGVRESQLAEVQLLYSGENRQHLALVHCSVTRGVTADGFAGDLRFIEDTTVGGPLSLKFADMRRFELSQTKVAGAIDFDGSTFQSLLVRDIESRPTWALGSFETRFGEIADSEFQSLHATISRPDESKGFIRLAGLRLRNGGALSLRGVDAAIERVHVESGALDLRGESDANETLPVVSSVRSTDLGRSVLGSVDLSRCALSESNGLSQARIESSVRFARPPAFGRVARNRRCLFDEIAWRSRRSRGSRRWHVDGYTVDVGGALEGGDRKVLPSPSAAEVGATYREMRHALESQGSGGTSGDFYYGEMEMRRLDPTSPVPDRTLLTLYWLTTGYGLRAWRAFLSLALVLVLGGWCMSRFGISGGVRFVDGVLYALQTSVPSSGTPTDLSRWGTVTDVVISVLGPLFFALGGLALRAKVRR